MKTIFSICIIGALLGFAPGGQGATNELATALQRGLFEEEANRNLPAAIKAYEAVVAQFDQDRRLAATAVFRLGECYRKQGRTNEAVVQYERVVREFSDYPELTGLSTQNLAGLRAPGTVTGGQPEEKGFPERLQEINARTSEATEIAEVNRIRAMIKDSPDLINSRDSMNENDTRLHTASRSGQAMVVQFLLENGAEVDARNKSGRTPLHEAAYMGRRAVVQWLLDRKADPNATDRNGNTPGHLAAGEGYKAVLEALLVAGADPNAKTADGTTPLHRAAAKDRKAVAELLLAKGARANEPEGSGQTALHLAAGAGNVSVLTALLDGGADIEAKDYVGATPLVVAVTQSRLPVVKVLLARKANPNVSYETISDSVKLRTWPLLTATPNLALMEALLAAGANPNARMQWSRIHPRDGWTPLMLAVISSSESLPAVQLLLKFKADVNPATEYGYTPLHFSLGQSKVMQELLEAKADVNAASKIGETPLHWAVAAGLKAVIQTLLTNQAKVDARDERGMTPLHWASVLGNKESAELLLVGKADPNARDIKDRTPLDLSRSQGSFNMYNSSEAPNLPMTRFSERQGYGLAAPVPLRPGTIALPGQATQSSYLSDDQKAFAETLKRHGAVEDFPRLDRIEVRRPSVNYIGQVFKRGTNDWNRFTLLELIGTHYYFLAAEPRGEGGSKYSGLPNGWTSPALEFPDFARLRIRRPGTTPGTWQEQTVDLSQALETGDCTSDVPLQWGDIVEIPVADHVLNEPWKGFSTTNLQTFLKCLSRKVDIVVKGKTNSVTLRPEVFFTSGNQPTLAQINTRSPYWIKPVLLNSKLLLASSDLSRIKITRMATANGEKQDYTLDCSESKPAPDFWLRDGDLIEVPDKE
jgi:cytohesin